MAINDGGPAFPQFEQEHVYKGDADRLGGYEFIPKDGMSLRDYFAAHALTFLQSRENVVAIIEAGERRGETEPETTFARIAYQVADAMLKAREGK